MSQFLSRKYLQYFGRVEAETIQTDTECPHCGYNLRGLPRGRRCPECGGDPMAPGEDGLDDSLQGGPEEPRPVVCRPLVDVLSSGGRARYERWRFGLSLAAVCLVAVVAARIIMLSLGLAGMTDDFQKAYIVCGLAVSVGWVTATHLLLPGYLGKVWRWTRGVRWFAVATQWLWIVAYGLWVAALYNVVSGDWEKAVHLLARPIAGAGFIAVAVLLAYMAEEAELERPARRINFAVWTLPIITPLVMLVTMFFPSSLANLPPGPPGLLAIIFRLPPIGFVAAWCFLLAIIIVSVWEMRSHTVWAQRHVRETEGREERVTETRRQIDRQVEGLIRPLPHREDGVEDGPGEPGAPAPEEGDLHADADTMGGS